MRFYDLHNVGMAVLLTAVFLSLCAGAFCLAMTCIRKHTMNSLTAAFCCSVNLVILVLYSSNMKAALTERSLPEMTNGFSRLPLIPVIAILLLVFLGELILLYQEYRFWQKEITKSSIKASFDHLNTGLCFSKPDGMVMLTNHRMVSLGFHLTGEEIQNAESFWKQLKAGEVNNGVICLSQGNTPEYQLEDGTVWTFHQEILSDAVQLTAVDTTELHLLMDQQRDENAKLKRMYQQIRDYGDKVDQYVIAKERLETRVNLHSFLGQALLTSRHYLQYENGDVDKILDIWQRNIDVLKLEAEPLHEADSFSELKANAKVVGIEVKTTGIIPEALQVKRLLASAGVEAVINAGKHADAKTLYIHIEETETHYIARYTNDGKAPAREIVEGGGLSSLRTKIERAGGRMNIESTPELAMTIMLEKGVTPYD